MNKLLRKLFLYASLGALVFVACSEDDSGVDVKEVVVDSLTWEELENKRTILYVDANRMESNDTIVDRDLRTFSTKELIKIEANSEGTGFA